MFAGEEVVMVAGENAGRSRSDEVRGRLAGVVRGARWFAVVASLAAVAACQPADSEQTPGESQDTGEVSGPETGSTDGTSSSGDAVADSRGGMPDVDTGAAQPSDADVDGDAGGGTSRLGPPRYLSEEDFDFENRLHAVDDLGMDPTGEEPIDDTLDEYRDSNTLIVFPPGTYKIVAGPGGDATHKWGPGHNNPAEHFGIKGLGDKPGDVEFLVEKQPANYGGRWLGASGGEGLMLKNFAFQMRDDRYTSVDMVLRKDDLLLVEKVEWKGIQPIDNHGNVRLLTTSIQEQSGVGELNRVYMRDGAIMADYPDGMSGIAITGHKGTMYATDLWLENRSSSALAFRGAGVTGRVGVEGGYYKNNANNNIRGCAGKHPDGPSYIRGATIVLDTENRSDSQPEDQKIRSSDALTVDAPSPDHKGLLIEDVDIYYRNPPGGLVLHRPKWNPEAPAHGAFTMRNSRVLVGNSDSRRLVKIDDPKLSIDETARFENVHFSGTGSGTIWAEASTTAEMVDSCLESGVNLENFDVVSNVSRSDCTGPQAPEQPPPR